jgi:hypothetical protein
MYPTRLLFLFVTLIILPGAQITNRVQAQFQTPSKQEQKSDFPTGEAFKNSKITYQLIPGMNNTWGYDILVNNKLIIHQPCIPSLPGNEGFKTKEDAAKVAKLVIEKMKKGEMPPSIDEKELKKLKVI